MNNDPAMVPVEQWPGLVVGAPVAQGARSVVRRGTIDGQPVAIRKTRRSAPSLEWELDLLTDLTVEGFRVPKPIPTTAGGHHHQGWSVVTWLDGRPPASAEDWVRVAAELREIHRRFRHRPQRPDCCAVVDLHAARRSVDADLDRTPPAVIDRCLAHFDPFLEAQRSVIHGDLHPGNIRIGADGRVGLIDWDESRVDMADLDLSNLGQPVLSGRRRAVAEAAAHAWEALNGWIVEPDYARSRLERLPAPIDRSTGPRLTDGRIVLRPRTERDIQAQVAGEDSQIIRWLTGGPPTEKRVGQHINHLARTMAADGLRRDFGIYHNRGNGAGEELIGNVDCNFADLDLELDEVNLSYAVFGPWRRRGFATAAINLTLAYLADLGWSDPEPIPTLKIDRNNSPSMALAKALGFVPVRAINTGDPISTGDLTHATAGELLVLQRPS